VPALLVRAWDDGDAEALDDAVDASREHLLPFMLWARAPRMTVGERCAWFAAQAAGRDRLHGAWEDGVLVGTVGLHDRIAPGGLEIGYWVHVDHLRRGVATAMVRQVCTIAFADPAVAYLEIRHDTANAASGRVAAAAGLAPVGEAPGPLARPPACTGIDRVWRLDRPT
jgi:ribosomal-protein-serine acetyltransferase